MKNTIRNRFRRRSSEPGMTKSGVAPGTLTYTGEARKEKPRISSILYKMGACVEQEARTDHKLDDLLAEGYLSWINVEGVHESALIEKVGSQFGLHPLVQEDIMNVHQRPKLEDYDTFLFCVMRMADINPGTGALEIEQVSLTIHEQFIISFQEDPQDIFDPIRNRIRQGKGKVNSMGPDYLAYLLLDAVVDRYFLILETFGERIDHLETELLENPSQELLKQVYALKQEISKLRKAVWPMREITSSVQKLMNPLLSDELNVYFQDLNDHIMRVMDSVESYRDTAASMIDLYLSSTSHRMNDVMKVLTVISTIFIPLTFITGYYGMNLKGMVEEEWPETYPIVIGVMVVMVVAQLIWFRKKKWL